MTVTPKEEYGLVGQKKFASQSLVFFYDSEHVNLPVGYTGEEMLRKCTYKKKARLTQTKDVLSCLFDKVMPKHKITSFKTTDSAVLHNWLIQFDD